MANILPDNEIIEFENQQYVNPQVSLDESTAFIENLRSSQAARNAETGQETAQLGTYPTPQSNLGGLGGGGSYFEARYSTPQGVALANNLRAAAQLDALNTALSNEKAMMKQRYQKTRAAYNRRRNTPTTPTIPEIPTDDGDAPEYETTTPGGTGAASVAGMSGAYTVVSPDGRLHVVDMNTGDETSLAPGEKTLDRTSASRAVGSGTIRVLPNGNRVLVKPGYGLTKEGDKYYLVNQSNGNKTQVGG